MDEDLSFALGSHGDHPGRSSQASVIGSDLTDDVGQLDQALGTLRLDDLLRPIRRFASNTIVSQRSNL
jgi:hypothetical protein